MVLILPSCLSAALATDIGLHDDKPWFRERHGGCPLFDFNVLLSLNFCVTDTFVMVLG